MKELKGSCAFCGSIMIRYPGDPEKIFCSSSCADDANGDDDCNCNLQYGCSRCRPNPESPEYEEFMACLRCGHTVYINDAGGGSCRHCGR